MVVVVLVQGNGNVCLGRYDWAIVVGASGCGLFHPSVILGACSLPVCYSRSFFVVIISVDS